MDAVGYVYVPASCAAQRPCRVHVAFHGCQQNASTIGDDYYSHAGYNEWADTNDLIVLYPQTIASGRYNNPASSIPYNPNGCWDWWGYTGESYARKDGPQIAAIEAMLRALAKGYTGWTPAPSARAPSLEAIDSSSSSVALAWTPTAGAPRYTLERAPGPACSTFAKVDGAVQGNSFSDSGLTPSTRYCYRLVREGEEPTRAAVAERTTTRGRPACDPYVRSVYQHWREKRTHLRWLKTYANGSNQYVGAIGPGSLFEEVLLGQTSPGYFVVGHTCE
jgi:poly(3-hydroxybutyrate) depolymerase